ncbi:MAG: F390 synthetase-related protein [Bacteroidota bacterium]|jgi:putative adenylate-forming enzyme
MNKLQVLKQFLGLKLRGKFRSREALVAYQEIRWAVFVNSTLTQSPFYLPYIKGGKVNRQTLPIIEKATFMDHFNEINTVGIDRDEAMALAVKAESSRDFDSTMGDITVGLSTGTSGKRGLFLISPSERESWVVMVMDRILPPKWLKKQKVAFFLRANSNLYTSVQSAIYDFKYFDIFQPIESLAKDLLVYQPDVLAGQPSILMALTDILTQGNSKPTPWRPKQIVSFAEVLHPEDAAVLKTVFDAPIREVYQCTEGLLGVSCDHGTMHLNEDNLIVEQEWIDDQYFRPIVTDFTRKSQPVIRYRMSDVLKVKQSPCECGSPFMAIEKILGRDDDVLWIQGKRVFPDVLSRKIALATDAFSRYEIVQTGEAEIQVYIQSNKFEETKAAIASVLDEYLLAQQNQPFQILWHSTKFNPSLKQRKIRHEIQHTIH